MSLARGTWSPTVTEGHCTADTRGHRNHRDLRSLFVYGSCFCAKRSSKHGNSSDSVLLSSVRDGPARRTGSRTLTLPAPGVGVWPGGGVRPGDPGAAAVVEAPSGGRRSGHPHRRTHTGSPAAAYSGLGARPGGTRESAGGRLALLSRPPSAPPGQLTDSPRLPDTLPPQALE